MTLFQMFPMTVLSLFFFFFFQAEDGIRDLTVTGVQTCALPIFIRKSLRMILEYEGYQCATAAGPQEGLDLARKEEPDVILLDIKMPQVDGLELLGRLKQRGDRAEVIMISGHGTIATAVEATRKGVFDFLEKPLEE